MSITPEEIARLRALHARLFDTSAQGRAEYLHNSGSLLVELPALLDEIERLSARGLLDEQDRLCALIESLRAELAKLREAAARVVQTHRGISFLRDDAVTAMRALEQALGEVRP